MTIEHAPGSTLAQRIAEREKLVALFGLETCDAWCHPDDDRHAPHCPLGLAQLRRQIDPCADFRESIADDHSRMSDELAGDR